MARRVEAMVKPELLIWARQSAGYDLSEAARKAHVKPEKLVKWEQGEARPTIRQLRELGRIYKRPLAVFYLPEPPQDFQPLRDYRRLPSGVVVEASPALRFEIRRAHDRRETALQLYEDLGEIPPPFAFSVSLGDDPEYAAGLLRDLLGITYEEQIKWKDEYEALNRWRLAIEQQGVLVFQASGIDLGEMRGFSISDLPLPVIAVNSRDFPRARVFTMLHEFGHIALQAGGLCEWDLDEPVGRLGDAQRIEMFCNRLAGATMVPQAELLREEIVAAKQDVRWTNDDLAILVSRYQATREVILRRLLITGRITREYYQQRRDEFQREFADYRRPTKGFVLPHQKTLASAGRLFVQLALSSYHQDKITASDLADLLDVRLNHVAKIEQALLERTPRLAA